MPISPFKVCFCDQDSDILKFTFFFKTLQIDSALSSWYIFFYKFPKLIFYDVMKRKQERSRILSQDGTERKENDEVRYPKNMVATHSSLKQLLLLYCGPFQKLDWQECTCYHLSRPSLLSLPLGQQGHFDTLLQVGLATADWIFCKDEQLQVGTIGGPLEGADATTAHKIRPYK